MAKSALAAGLSWPIARAVTGVSDPVLAPLTALVVVQVSVRASVRTALERSAGVVLGVLLALALGDALGLNGLTVGVLVAVSLGVAELVLRLPASEARQIPISVLVVLTAVAADPVTQGWNRALGTVVGAGGRRRRLAGVAGFAAGRRPTDARPVGGDPRRRARHDGRRIGAAVVDRPDRGMAPARPHGA